MSGDVFISYASQDKPVADAVCEALERAGLACWIAPRDVTPGEFYAESIVHAIDSARIVVLVLSHHGAVSPHVLREVERASSKRHPVVSFRIDLAPLPAGLEYFLNTSQWLDASAVGVDRALPRLVEAVQSALVHSQAPAGASPAPAAIATARRRSRRLPVALAVLVGASLVYWLVDRFSLATRVDKGQPPVALAMPAKSVAVLPFVDMSEQHDQEYFSDGLSEELIDHLAHNADLKVIARTSSFAFKGKNEDIRSIASKLGVANLLEGSVRKSGSTLRITAQLIRASDGVHLWSESYDRKLTDIFKVQDEISATVAKALNVALHVTPAAGMAPASKGTSNIAAYNFLLKGNYFYTRGQAGDDAKALVFFQQAVKLDPHYAAAWAKLARFYAWQGNSGGLLAAEAEIKSRDAVQRALAIDPNCAEAYFARGNILRLILGDWTAAMSDYEKVVALEPHGEIGEQARGNIFYSNAIMSGQYGDIIDWNRRQLERNPLEANTYADLAWNQQYAGRLEESAATSRKLLELNPAYATAQAQYGGTLLLLGNPVEALAAAEQESDDATRLTTLAGIYWAIGRRAESDSALGALERRFSDRNEYLIAMVHAYRGEADAAFMWLDRAYQQRKGSLQDLKSDPFFKKLHGDPRFNALLRQLKLLE